MLLLKVCVTGLVTVTTGVGGAASSAGGGALEQAERIISIAL
jgi:hypothetical protein